MPDMGPLPDAVETQPIGAVQHKHPYAVLRNRDLLLYLIGRFVASLGQQMLIVAVGWELYERTHSSLALGMSPRATLCIMRAARVRAAASGRNYVTPDDVKNLAVPVLAHRLLLAPDTDAEDARTVIDDALTRVPAF